MVQFGGPHDRGCHLGQQPRQRNLCHGNVSLFRQLRHPVNDALILLRCGVILEFGVAILLQALGGLAGVLGKPAACQGTVRCHGDVVLGAKFCHLPFFLPEDQVIVALDGDELRKSFFLCQGIGLGQLIGKAVGDADIADLSGLYGAVQPV